MFANENFAKFTPSKILFYCYRDLIAHAEEIAANADHYDVTAQQNCYGFSKYFR